MCFETLVCNFTPNPDVVERIAPPRGDIAAVSVTRSNLSNGYQWQITLHGTECGWNYTLLFTIDTSRLVGPSPSAVCARTREASQPLMGNFTVSFGNDSVVVPVEASYLTMQSRLETLADIPGT